MRGKKEEEEKKTTEQKSGQARDPTCGDKKVVSMKKST